MRHAAIVILLNVFMVTLVAADCAFVSGKIIRGHAIRCEDPTAWVDAYRAARPKKPAATITVYATEKEEHQGTGTILVVKVNWELQFAPLYTGAKRERIRADGPWKQVIEHGRFWLQERPEYCESLARRVPVELWVRPPCCDTGAETGVCPAKFDEGSAVTEEVRSWFADLPSPE